jgi:hypothetical protein
MALEITGNIELDNGLTLPSVYGRTNYRVNNESSSVTILTDFYQNESGFEQNKLLGWTPNIPLRYAYNREVDGEDVLMFTQEKIKAELEAKGFSVVITNI